MAPTTTLRVRVDAPDVGSAFALERCLSHIHPAHVLLDERWSVEVDAVDETFGEISDAIREWLEATGQSWARVAIGDRKTRISTLDGAPLGEGYDGPALEHEP